MTLVCTLLGKLSGELSDIDLGGPFESRAYSCRDMFTLLKRPGPVRPTGDFQTGI